MRKKNGHQTSLPKPIRLYSWRQRLKDKLSPSFFLALVYTLGLIVVLLDVFIWRP